MLLNFLACHICMCYLFSAVCWRTDLQPVELGYDTDLVGSVAVLSVILWHEISNFGDMN